MHRRPPLNRGQTNDFCAKKGVFAENEIVGLVNVIYFIDKVNKLLYNVGQVGSPSLNENTEKQKK